jgi:hypothetical protein
MDSKQTKLTRQELYEKVWSTPCRTLAKEFGVSDVAVGKACRKNNIPLPGLGYWAKDKAGKPVEKIPLPPIENEKVITFSSGGREINFADYSQMSEADKISLSIKENNTPINIIKSLKNLHPAVQRTYDINKLSSKDNYGRHKSLKCIDLTVSEKSLTRAIHFLNTLAKCLQQNGFDIVPETENSYAYALVLEEKIKFNIYEGVFTIEKPLTDAQLIRRAKDHWYNPQPEYEYKTNGNLFFKIDADTENDGIRKLWSDSEKHKLENLIKQIIVGFIRISVKQRAVRLAREAREKEWEERHRLAAEEERKQREEQERIDALEKYVAAWLKCKNIRAYLEALKTMLVERHGNIEPGSKADEYFNWAFSYADRLDPLAPR